MIWSVATMVLTLIHHFYGAMIYNDKFRLHVAVYAIPVIIILLLAYLGFRRSRSSTGRKIFLTILLVVSAIFPVIAIGFYEGGYNHVVKNILYFTGVSTDTLDRLYPSIYKLPDDFIFEFTGIAQLVTGLVCGIKIIRMLRRNEFSTE